MEQVLHASHNASHGYNLLTSTKVTALYQPELLLESNGHTVRVTDMFGTSEVAQQGQQQLRQHAAMSILLQLNNAQVRITANSRVRH